MQLLSRPLKRQVSLGALAVILGAAAFGVPIFGCGSASSNTSLLLNIVILLITRAAGGIVKDNNTTLTIPPDSLQVDTTIKIQPTTGLPAAPAGLFLVPGTAYTYGPAGTAFSPSAAISETYLPSTIPSYVFPKNLGLYSVSGTSFTLVAGSTVDTTTNTVTAPISSLGTYVLMGLQPIQDPP